MTTTNMSLNEPSVGTTAGPTWATELNANFTTIDQHDHTSGKGVQLTPSALNINSDLEFNGNAAIELKRLTIDSSATGSGTNYSVYQSGGNLYWYNGSGQAVQITNGANVKTTGGSIDGMDSTDAGADYGSGYFKWEFDTTKTPFAGAKMKNADIELHKYDGSSGSNAYVILKYTGSSEGSNNITVPDETGTLVTSASTLSDISVTSTTASKPILTLANNAVDATAPFIDLKNLRNGGAGSASDDLGTIRFYGSDGSGTATIFSSILAEIVDPVNGQERGKLSLSVAEYDGTVTPGLILTGATSNGIVDATIGAGSTSTTTISGNLDVTKIDLTDNLASALDITEASNSYLKFVTTNSGEKVVFGKEVDVSGTTLTTSTAQKEAISATAFASGTKMLFQQTAAPTGWTKVTSSNDVALRVVSGTVGSGGSVAFETAFASQSIPVTTLTTSQIPAHTHGSRYAGEDSNAWRLTSGPYYGGVWEQGQSVGGGGSHGHSSINLDVSFVDVIIATKD